MSGWLPVTGFRVLGNRPCFSEASRPCAAIALAVAQGAVTGNWNVTFLCHLSLY
jgi:hypothetical protein